MNGVYIWGTGMIANELYQQSGRFFKECGVKGFIDNDRDKWGRFFCGWPVYSPSILSKDSESGVFIATQYENDIRFQIADIKSFSGKIVSPYFFDKLELLERYRQSDDIEIKEIVEYLRYNDLSNFNYSFLKNYDIDSINVRRDPKNGLFYSMVNNDRLYLSRRFNNEIAAKTYLYSIQIEQDICSPHRYLTDTFCVNDGSIIVDAGAAEGLFSLENISKANHIYLFEPDPGWCEAIRYTFEPYKDKITVINKAISNYTSETVVRLDDALCGERIDFIKMDIEGEEYYALMGADIILSNTQEIKCVICTYHQEFAYNVIYSLMQEKGFDVETSRGYMWFDDRNVKYRPYVLRKGLVRARKGND